MQEHADDALALGILFSLFVRFVKSSSGVVTYEKVKDVELKSVQEAYDELIDGRFKIYKENIRHIEFEQVEIGYELDSKGFYQPIYVFSGLIDGESTTILILGIE